MAKSGRDAPCTGMYPHLGPTAAAEVGGGREAMFP